MYSQIKTFSILAIAGTAIAAPQGWGNWGQGHWRGGNDNQPAATETAIAVVTAYTTVYEGAQSTAQPTQAPSAVPGNFYNKPSPAAPAATSAAPAAPAASSPVASSGSTDSWMAVVSTWRSKMGLGALTEDSTLVANAFKTVKDSNGKMVHELNPGSMAQVLAPGSADDFENVFVGGWLCEIPTLPGLDGICSSMSAGWDYAGQTGHADILSSTTYSKIGCALDVGIWACDLA